MPVIAVEFSGANIVATATTPACLVGSLEYDFRFQLNDGAWPAYDGIYVPSYTASQAFTQGHKYAYQVRVRRSGSTSTVESDPSPSVVAQVNSPSAPTLTVAISGANVVANLSAVTCPAGTQSNVRMRWIDTATHAGGSWSAWSSWYANIPVNNTRGLNEGWRSTYQGEGFCDGLFDDSGVVSTGDVSAIRGMGTPAAPTWAGVSGWYSGYNASKPGLATYNTYCPPGAWTTRQWFYSIAWNGIRFDHDFPYNDWWYTGSTDTKYVEYHAWYTCATDFASATSAESYITGRPVWP